MLRSDNDEDVDEDVGGIFKHTKNILDKEFETLRNRVFDDVEDYIAERISNVKGCYFQQVVDFLLVGTKETSNSD